MSAENDIVQFRSSRWENWVTVLLGPLLCVTSAAYTVFPSLLKASVTNDDESSLLELLAFIPSWVISLFAFWCFVASSARIFQAGSLLRTRDPNYSLESEGLLLVLGADEKFFNWSDMAKVYVRIKGPNFRLKIRLYSEREKSPLSVLKRFFFIHTIPDAAGPTLHKVIDEVAEHVKLYAPKDIVDIQPYV